LFTPLLAGDIVKKSLIISVSAGIMGAAQLFCGQIVKGLGYLLLEIAFIYYMVTNGVNNLIGLTTLGTQEQGMVYNEATQLYERIDGENSMKLLLAGVVAIVVIVFFCIMWYISLKSGKDALNAKEEGKKVNSFVEDFKSLFDKNAHKLLLFIPITGLILFTVMPLIYMILIAFTNFDVNHQPPGKLFDWVGIRNFKILIASSDVLTDTFWPILGWTTIWAFFATFTNYFGGMLLAIMINIKSLKYKKLWRTVFVISISIPSFISLMIIRTMLNQHGIINIGLINMGFITESLPFLTNPTWARVSVIVTNMWIGIPFTMLITTGILSNIPTEIYESARIDGANPVKIFTKITFPYIFFITTPYLILNFVGNFNNFNPIYLMTEGGPLTLDYFKGAGKTDLLVTWLFKLTQDSFDYCYASAIGIIVFIITASLSLIVYSRTKAYTDEEGMQL
jgi:arabinogalactan oligomer/maltooligosaccharide transport system permease protein